MATFFRRVKTLLFVVPVAAGLCACDKPAVTLPANGLAKLRANPKFSGKQLHANETATSPPAN